jgi:hypothetical protein
VTAKVAFDSDVWSDRALQENFVEGRLLSPTVRRKAWFLNAKVVDPDSQIIPPTL